MQRDPIVGVEPQIEPRQHRLARGVADARPFEGDQRRARARRVGKGYSRRRFAGGEHHRLEPGQRLQPALRLARLRRLGAKAVDKGLQPLALVGLLSRQNVEPPRVFAPHAQERVEAPGIGGQLALFEMQRHRRHRVQHAAVVADQYQAAAIEAQVAFEPQRGFEIEVVGRLVEQQQVGLGEQYRRQCHPHPPPAGQLVERPALHRVVEPEPGEDARRPARRRMGVDLDEPRFDLGGAQRRRPGFALGQQAGALAIGGEHRLVRGCGAARRLLSEKPDAVAAGQLDRAVLGLQHPAYQVEQGRFADAVAADQPDFGALGDLRTRPVEQRPMAVDTVGHLEQGQHGGLISSDATPANGRPSAARMNPPQCLPSARDAAFPAKGSGSPSRSCRPPPASR